LRANFFSVCVLSALRARRQPRAAAAAALHRAFTISNSTRQRDTRLRLR
jgi:hypothetical protein